MMCGIWVGAVHVELVQRGRPKAASTPLPSIGAMHCRAVEFLA